MEPHDRDREEPRASAGRLGLDRAVDRALRHDHPDRRLLARPGGVTRGYRGDGVAPDALGGASAYGRTAGPLWAIRPRESPGPDPRPALLPRLGPARLANPPHGTGPCGLCPDRRAARLIAGAGGDGAGRRAAGAARRPAASRRLVGRGPGRLGPAPGRHPLRRATRHGRDRPPDLGGGARRRLDGRCTTIDLAAGRGLAPFRAGGLRQAAPGRRLGDHDRLVVGGLAKGTDGPRHDLADRPPRHVGRGTGLRHRVGGNGRAGLGCGIPGRDACGPGPSRKLGQRPRRLHEHLPGARPVRFCS